MDANQKEKPALEVSAAHSIALVARPDLMI